MKLSFDEVVEIFKSYKIWLEGKELLWYRKDWAAEEKRGNLI